MKAYTDDFVFDVVNHLKEYTDDFVFDVVNLI